MNIPWPPGPLKPQLRNNDIHLWLARLDVPRERLAHYDSLLSEDEQSRAGRFRFGRLRDRYIAGRGMLRELLGRYLEQSPGALEFTYSHYGKPNLRGKLYFNLAHSRDLALFAFTRKVAVGVDIEAERDLPDALALARRFFSPAEYETLQALPDEQRAPAFFQCWCLKEAFIKAVGEGLSYPLNAFEVSLGAGEPARLLSISGSRREAEKWTLLALDLPLGYFGAAAANMVDCQCSQWHFD